MEKVSQTIIKEVKGERSFLVLIKSLEEGKGIITLQPLCVDDYGHPRQSSIKVYEGDLVKALKKLQVEFAEGKERKEKEREREEISSESIDALELSRRSCTCLKNASIETISQLVAKSESELLKSKNFGRKSLSEIKEKLGERGLSLRQE